MTFTDRQVAEYRKTGYIAVPSFFDACEIAAIAVEVERFKRTGLLCNVATDGDGKTHSQSKQNLQLCPMSPHSALFRALPFAAKVGGAVSQLIGDPVMLHLDQVFLKPGSHGAGTNWHQDNAYFKLEDPLKGTAMWIAVHDASVANGTLHVIPKAHQRLLEHTRDPESDHHFRCYPPEELAVPMELPAGGAVFFAYGVPHCTKANTTERERAGAAFHFLNASAISTDYFSQSDSVKHPILTGSSASDGVAEYGSKVAGSWDSEVARALHTTG